MFYKKRKLTLPQKVIVCFIVVFLTYFACGRREARERQPARPLDKVIITTPGRDPVEVTVEPVITPEAQAKGLMGRDRLDPYHGMLFIFPEEDQRTFWMKNTLIELDMIFIRSDGEVLGCVERAKPMTTFPRSVEGNSKYVLEVPGGFCREHGIGARTKFKFVLPTLNMNE